MTVTTMSKPRPGKGETLGDIAFRRLRADIIAGAWAPESRLRFETLRARYGLNFGTLREVAGAASDIED